uniref:NADH-ubiquinone oxidoreductase chain 2 n=1 Tax=Argulus japonicus TaxID=873553 RepID=A0A7I8F3W2_9CRUS|nr:NADH dehydrogenase subunit 2 [Argulus japonicus]
MFLIPPQIIFLLPLFLGTFIVISSNSWFSLWLGLELNVISFIPMLFYSSSLTSAESAISYFLIQAFSSLILVSYIFISNIYSLWSINTNFIMTMTMMLKMGAAPFHSWVILMTKSLPWPLMILLLSWQKINPLYIVSITSSKIEFFVVINAVIGAMSGLTHLSLRKLMIFSSLVHSSWIFLSMKVSLNSWILYFAGYCINSIIPMTFFYLWNINFVKDIFNFKSLNINSSSLCFSIMNLAGLPPFSGFYLKWMILMQTAFFSPLISLMVVMSSLTSLWFYLRIMYSAFTLSSMSANKPLMKTSYSLVIPMLVMGPLFISIS